MGAILSSDWLGTLVTLLPWGLLTDRIGERIVLCLGLGGCGLLLIAAGQADTFWQLYVLLFLAGCGRCERERRQRARRDGLVRRLAAWPGPRDPAGGGPGRRPRRRARPAAVHRARRPTCSSASSACSARRAGAIFLREPAALPLEVHDVEWSLRDRRLWRLCSVSGLYVVAQMAILSFVVLYLHDERGLSNGQAAAVLGAVQVSAIVLRIGAGRWSDTLRTRTVPLARIGMAMSISLAVATALLYAPLVLLVPAFVVAGSLTMAWNGVAFAAAAELAGRARTGAALSVQQTVLSLAGVAAPLGFAAVVTAGSWSLAYGLAAVFPIGGWLVLRTMREPEKARLSSAR